jgi:hypothetical protein
VQVILGHLFPKLTVEERLYSWFHQDSAIPCSGCRSMQALSDIFGGRIISSRIWPARSPDPSPCDVFFLGCLKDKGYNSNPQTEEELKENICRQIVNIPAQQLQKLNKNLFRRWDECLHVWGQHF